MTPEGENQGSGASDDPFADDDPLAGVGGDDDFDALGFDSSFGASPADLVDMDTGFGVGPGAPLGDADDTPPGGIYVGEEVQVLDASTIGRALAEASGKKTEEELPDMATLQRGLVGIDIGAAKAVVAQFDGDGRHEIVPNQDDDLSTPMHIFFDEDGERLVGREARAMAPSAPDRAVVNLKQSLEDPGSSKWKAGDESDEVNPREALVILMGRLLADVKAHSHEPATHVALAAPAWFGPEQREVLRQAMLSTGVEVVGVTDEALAAAVPYSLRLPDLKARKALVFDLGHAALGVAIVRCASGDIEVLAQEASRELGSCLWDELLANEAARKFEEAHGIDPRQDEGANVDLRLRAEDAKRALSERAKCTLVVSCQGKTLKIGFTRRGFESAAKKLVEGARELVVKVRDAAGITDWSELDALILTGGGSRTPSLRKMLTDEIGLKPERGIGPEEGVAVGALYWGIGARHAML